MYFLKFLDSDEVYDISFERKSNHVVKIINPKLPKNVSGFSIGLNATDCDTWHYFRYRTIFRELENGLEFSDDGSTYTPDPEPTPTKDVFVMAEWFQDTPEDRPEGVYANVFVDGNFLEEIRLTADIAWGKKYTTDNLNAQFTIQPQTVDGYDREIKGSVVTYTKPIHYIPTTEEQLASINQVLCDLDDRIFALESEE